MKRTRFLSLLLGMTLLAPAAGARTIFVKQDAPGPAHDGASWATAYLTLAKALLYTVPGDEVWVARGVYGDYISVPGAVSVYGGFDGTETQKTQRDWKTHFSVMTGGFECDGEDIGNVVVDGLTMRNAVQGITVWSGTATLQNNAITGNNGDGVSVMLGTTATLIDNTIYGSTSNGVYVGGKATLTGNMICGNLGDGVYAHAAGTVTGYGNQICGNGEYGVRVESGAGASFANGTIAGNQGYGVHVGGGTVVLVNDTITGNGYGQPGIDTVFAGVHLGQWWGGDPAKAYIGNSIIASNGGYGVRLESNGSVPVFTCNDVSENAVGAYSSFTPPSGQGNIEADPMLTTIYQNVHLRPGSPCINTGNDAIVEGATDIDGRARIDGAHVDIGADEWDGTAWPTAPRVLCVSPSGSDANDGTAWAKSKATVVSALLAARSTDEVWVAKGVYYERVVPSGGVSLYGGFTGTETDRGQRDWRANATVLDGGERLTRSVVESFAPNVTLDGFHIRFGKIGAMVTGPATLSHNAVYGNESSGVYLHYGPVDLVNNTVHNNREDGVSIWQGPGNLIGNTVSGNGSVGVNVGAELIASDPVRLVNNTITGNGRAGVLVSATADLSNNLLAYNQGSGMLKGDYGIVAGFSHNDVYGNVEGEYSGYMPPAGQDNISVDPKLSGIFQGVHIKPDSPCIDAGDDSVVQAGDTDIDSQPRIRGAHVDIGSDESDGKPFVLRLPSRWHVSPAGNDTADGLSWATAKRTLFAADRAAQAGDEIWVAEGTYKEFVYPPVDVSLYGGFSGTETERGQRDWKTHPTVLVGQGFGTVVTCMLPATVLDGFLITYAGDEGLLTSSRPASISHVAISGSANAGLHVAGVATVTDTTISGSGDQGVIVDHDSKATLTSCTIAGNCGTGVAVDGTADLANCTITASGGSGLYVSGTASLVNCIVASNSIYGLSVSTASYLPGSIAAFSHNDVFGNLAGSFEGYTPPGGQGNLSIDPKLSHVVRNVHILPDSPCIDAGDDSVVQAGETDIDNQPRIRGAHVDIGSDEFDGTNWTTAPRILRVSPQGDDAKDGLSWATAKKTLPAAVYTAEATDEVWVAAGTYTGYVKLPAGVALYGGFAGTETQRSQRNWRVNATVWSGSSTNMIHSVGYGTRVDGFTIRGKYWLYTGSATIQNNIITGSASNGMEIESAATIVCNLIANNRDRGLYIESPSTVAVCNNTIVRNGTGIYVSRPPLSSDNIQGFHGNLIANNTTKGFARVTSASITAFSHNDVFGNPGGDYDTFVPPAGQGNLSLDPVFADTAKGDYRLQSTSPCIDAGNDAAVEPGGTDLAGGPRIQGAHVDIGAYEYGAAAQPFTVLDVSKCLSIAAGLGACTPDDLARLNVETANPRLDTRDALRLARKAAGLEPNP